MRCAYESQLEALTIFPFPGLKIVNIRGEFQEKCINTHLITIIFSGNALLTLDLIIINHFISRLQSDNLLLELSLRDQVITNRFCEQKSIGKIVQFTLNLVVSIRVEELYEN